VHVTERKTDREGKVAAVVLSLKAKGMSGAEGGFEENAK